MFRVILSILLVVAFTGASLASVMHDITHGSDHAEHHASMSHHELPADAEPALAECCDAVSGKGSASCFGDLLAGAMVAPISLTATGTDNSTASELSLIGRTLAVPTGPPKV